MIPDWVTARLRRHRQTFRPVWRGFLCDHFAMTTLALIERDEPRESIEAWMLAYEANLEPNTPFEPVSRWQDGLGNVDAFLGLIEFFEREFDSRGVEATVQTYFPQFLSGWARNAFHPIIRLAYGLRFELESEIAAGLAYAVTIGTSSRLADLADRSTTARRLNWPTAIGAGVKWDDKLDHFMANNPDFVPHTTDATVEDYGDAVLEILNATHHFFALHLVTAYHAFRVVSQTVPLPPAYLAAGMTVGFAAAGAPAFTTGVPPAPFTSDTEHDVKIAFSCRELARLNGHSGYDALAGVLERAMPPLNPRRA